MIQPIASHPTKSGGTLTREKFLAKELHLVAQMRLKGATNEQIIAAAVEDNLFQFPTTKESRSIARACLNRLDALESDELTKLAAYGTAVQLTQVNIYAMMQHYRLMRAFMIDEIGMRYKIYSPLFTSMDMNAFMTRYQAEHEEARDWSEATTARIKGTLHHCLIEGGYLRPKSEELCPILLDYEVEQAIRSIGDREALSAFNCLEIGQ